MSEERKDELLFRVTAPDGRVYEIFTSGKTTGFPPGSVVFNGYPLQAQMETLKFIVGTAPKLFGAST